MSKKESSRENVKVVCRIRPSNQKEIAIGGFQCVQHTTDTVEVTTEDGLYNFTFDQIFGPDSTQVAIFEYTAIPLIADVLNGYNSTIFAYGQTSSGKTFTMEGPDIHDEQYKGIIPRTVEALFAGVSEADENIEFTFKVSYSDISKYTFATTVNNINIYIQYYH
jgi:kinesin family protein 5